MLAIYAADTPVVFKAPKTSYKAESVSQGTKPGAKPGHKKLSTSLKQPSVSRNEATKGGSSKAPTSSKTGHSKKRKDSSSAIDLNPSQPPVSTIVDTGMHKKDQQATGDPTSLVVTRNVALAASTAEAEPGKSAPSTNPHVLADQTKSISEGLETVLTQPRTRKGASSIARQIKEEEASNTIKLEDLEKLVSNMQPSFKDLDSPEYDPVIVVDDSDEDGEDEVHTTTEDTPVPKSSSLRSSQIQELTNQVFILQSEKHKLEIEKNKGEAKVDLLKAQSSFPNMGQLNELLVKSLKTEFSKILSTHDFSSSLPTELKDLPSKFNELAEEVKGLKQQVHELEIELPEDLKEIISKLEDFTKTVTSLTSQVADLKTLQWELLAEFVSLLVQVTSVQAKLKTLDALPSLLLNVTKL
ncbi:hypothetical protein Tco_0759652 [Tanacetum coccineum]